MKPPGKSAGSGSISRLVPQFADRGRLKPSALRHQKGEQKTNRESLRRVRAVNRLCDCKALASARRSADVTAVTRRKQRIEVSSSREVEALFSMAKTTRIMVRANRSCLNPLGLGVLNGERKSNRESHPSEAAVAEQNSSNRENEACLSPSTFDKCEGNGNGGAEKRAGLNAKARPYNGNGGNQKHRLAAAATSRKAKFDTRTQLASDKTFERKQHEKRIKDPSKFVAVRKKSSLCFVQLTRNLNDTMFRLERVAERRKFKGRP